MNAIRLIALCSLIISPAVGLRAEVLSDDFNDNTVNAAYWTGDDGDTALLSFQEQNQRLELISTQTGSTELQNIYRGFDYPLPYDSNWSLSFDVANLLPPEVDPSVRLGFSLYSYSQADFVAVYLKADSGGNRIQRVGSDDMLPFSDLLNSGVQGAGMFNLTFDAGQKILAINYKNTGGSLVALQTIAVAGAGAADVVDDWGMTSGESFDFAFDAYVTGTPIGSGEAYIDNLQINVVPEPSTWALTILGLGAIGLALRRRWMR